MYSLLSERIIYPLGDIVLGTSVTKYYRWMQKTQWYAPQQLQELQNNKLRALIKHAYENVPYYRRIFDQRGLTVNDIQTINDLPKLPVLTKTDIQKNFHDIVATNLYKWKPVLSATGGSTGEPLRYYITKDAASINWAGMFRGWGWAGYRLGDKRINVGGSSMVSKNQNIQKTIRLFAERTSQISTLNVSERRLDSYTRKILRNKPKYIYGYTSSIYMIAEYIINQGINAILLKGIFTTSEMLTPYFRNTIEKAFNCKILDCYGCYDGGPQALECPSHEGYHLSAEKAIMEFLDEEGNAVHFGQPGEIVVTDLHNYAMPFIRYKVGDIGVPAKEMCSCGRGLPLMKSLEGRKLDFIALPNGSKVRGSDLIDLFYKLGREQIKELPTISKFQIVQNRMDELVVRIIQKAPPSDSETEYIKAELLKVLFYPVDIKLEFVERIDDFPNGKRNFVISNISASH
jgi:phenylacetate-CoA ligase